MHVPRLFANTKYITNPERGWDTIDKRKQENYDKGVCQFFGDGGLP